MRRAAIVLVGVVLAGCGSQAPADPPAGTASSSAPAASPSASTEAPPVTPAEMQALLPVLEGIVDEPRMAEYSWGEPRAALTTADAFAASVEPTLDDAPPAQAQSIQALIDGLGAGVVTAFYNADVSGPGASQAIGEDGTVDPDARSYLQVTVFVYDAQPDLVAAVDGAAAQAQAVEPRLGAVRSWRSVQTVDGKESTATTYHFPALEDRATLAVTTLEQGPGDPELRDWLVSTLRDRLF